MPIFYTPLLKMQHVGRVPRDGAPGEFGLMNWGLYNLSETHPQAFAALDFSELDELATLFTSVARPGENVGVRTIRSWFNIRSEARNCVPLRVTGLPARNGEPRYPPRRFCNLEVDDRLRGILAACLAVPGGLQRLDPVWTKPWKKGKGTRPPWAPDSWDDLYVEEQPTLFFGALAEAVAYVESVLDGNEYDDHNMRLGVAWVRLQIEYTGSWDVRMWRSWPQNGDDSEDYTCMKAQERGDP